MPNLAKWDKSQPGNFQPSSLVGTCLTLPNLGFLWVFFKINTLKYPKMGICYFFLWYQFVVSQIMCYCPASACSIILRIFNLKAVYILWLKHKSFTLFYRVELSLFFLLIVKRREVGVNRCFQGLEPRICVVCCQDIVEFS